ncbi:hypothetical protein [Winogradskyella sp.]|jgi:hypothetical protein|uniref:hypothetical protein n=1 Tax=Winogradskyella sp. TaxID=1883156 RepID=UPI0025F11913|nr:hypothetical protein [Winogradskyella sp.]MCT4628464.1 hypothetical protein [Winogradskyella sp.]
MKKLSFLFIITIIITSCNVTESIVFDKSMSGNYVTGFDLSPMMEYANKNRPPSEERERREKMDTTIVFNEFLKTYKDSIATLPEEERLKLEKLKGMVLDIEMDEAKSVFNFNMSKEFEAFDELKTIYEQTDEAMNYVKDIGNKDGQAPQQQLDEFTKTEKVTFSFKNNTFSRFQPATLDSNNSVEDDKGEEEESAEDDQMKDMMMMQFEDVLSNSFYTLVYTFPKKVKSVSSKDATISEDGKTVTYKVSWSAINGDASIMNLDVVLED